jgi:serine protease Do
MNMIEQLNADLAGAVQDVHRTLVEVRNGRGGAGAGTIWRSDGLIITNAHVVGKRNLKVTLPDGRTLPAQVVAHDAEHDVAALQVQATGLPTIELGDSQQLRPGEWVMAIGHPWGVAGAVTAGVVIGKGAQLPEMPPGREWVVVSLHMRPGHSGGPLVDTRGRLVGINTMITGPDVGVAVPVHVAKEFVKQAGLDTPKRASPEHQSSYV